jgi:hypothetical protein
MCYRLPVTNTKVHRTNYCYAQVVSVGVQIPSKGVQENYGDAQVDNTGV